MPGGAGGPSRGQAAECADDDSDVRPLIGSGGGGGGGGGGGCCGPLELPGAGSDNGGTVVLRTPDTSTGATSVDGAAARAPDTATGGSVCGHPHQFC